MLWRLLWPATLYCGRQGSIFFLSSQRVLPLVLPLGTYFILFIKNLCVILLLKSHLPFLPHLLPTCWQSIFIFRASSQLSLRVCISLSIQAIYSATKAGSWLIPFGRLSSLF